MYNVHYQRFQILTIILNALLKHITTKFSILLFVKNKSAMKEGNNSELIKDANNF